LTDDKELSDDFIDDLLKPKKTSSPSYEVPGTKKRVKYDPTIRSVSNWFRLPHVMEGECEIPNHDENRQSRTAPRLFFILEDGRHICRWCFVESRDQE
jgi:hypothetical protein